MFGKNAVGPAERGEDLTSVRRVEKVAGGGFSPSTSRISRSLMKRLTEIQKSSRTITRAWTRSPSQCRRAATSSVSVSVPPGEQPLLELVEHEQHLLAGPEGLPPPEGRERLDESEPRGQVGANPAQGLQQPSLGLVGRRLDVNREDVLLEPGQQPRLDQRRFAAARGAVDQADLEGASGSVASMRVFQNRSDSGKPSRSRGPGRSSRKKSASFLSNDRRPLGTTLTEGPLSEPGRAAVDICVTARARPGANGWAAIGPLVDLRKAGRSSVRSQAVG